MISSYLTLIAFIAADLFWWRAVDARLAHFSRRRTLRVLLGAFMAAQVIFVLMALAGDVFGFVPSVRPHAWPIAVYLWHILFLPLGCVIVLPDVVRRIWARAKAGQLSLDSQSMGSNSSAPTRRQVLGASIAALPPLLTLATTGIAERQWGTFRVRRVTLRLPSLPPDLDGLTIAHVTDLHIGRFMPPALAGPIADAINAMPVDLVAFTGDLIDVTSPSVLPGIEFIRRLNPRHGLVLIEGNHDVMRDADRFEKPVKDAGLSLLLDETMTVRVPGRATPVQFSGITWGNLRLGSQIRRHGRERNLRFRVESDEAAAESVARVAALRAPGAFPILLAHHPHAFDPGAASGFPLVLSGHTHGGQLMLTKNIGVGPLRFRYWQGVYQKPGSQLFISNGVGSWFPLRVNAPAEIVHLTLRRADMAQPESQQ
jgi:uncharacterized protein